MNHHYANQGRSYFRRLARLLGACLCVFLLLFAFSAEAITLKQAARQVAKQYDGNVVAARTVEQNGRRIHIIRVVTKQGVVKTVRIPE
jgi:uncharacterized membrane protein YkoI